MKVLKIFIISTPPTMQWLHVDDINEYFTKNGCICNNPIIQGHRNFQDLEISMTRERVRPWKFPSPMENSMAHGNFHARPYLSLDSRCEEVTEVREKVRMGCLQALLMKLKMACWEVLSKFHSQLFITYYGENWSCINNRENFVINALCVFPCQ